MIQIHHRSGVPAEFAINLPCSAKRFAYFYYNYFDPKRVISEKFAVHLTISRQYGLASLPDTVNVCLLRELE